MAAASENKAKFLSTNEDVICLLQACETFLFDLDGVIWLQNKLIPGSVDAVQCLREMGKRVFFITNNNTKTRDDFIVKFAKFGLKVDKNEIYTAAFATAYYMKHIAKFDKKAYMIGGKGLSQELSDVGITNIGYGRDDVADDIDIPYDVKLDLDPEVGAVVSGFDKYITINKLLKATSYLAKDTSCLFIATNPDSRMPVPNSQGFSYFPGSGCFAAYLEKATGRTAMYGGKPSSVLFECIVKEHNIDPSTTCMVGDTLETDMLFGNTSGAKTLLVFSGNSNQQSLDTAIKNSDDRNYIPDFVIQSVGHLMDPAKMLIESKMKPSS